MKLVIADSKEDPFHPVVFLSLEPSVLKDGSVVLMSKCDGMREALAYIHTDGSIDISMMDSRFHIQKEE